MSLPLSSSDSEKIEKLIEQLASRDGGERQEARESLVEIGAPAVILLSDLLKNPNHHVRWEAAKALGEINNPAVAPALVTAMEDEESDIRWLGAEGLLGLGIDAVRPLLKELIDKPGSFKLREGAHHVINDLVQKERILFLTPVLDALNGPAPEDTVPVAATNVLRELE